MPPDSSKHDSLKNGYYSGHHWFNKGEPISHGKTLPHICCGDDDGHYGFKHKYRAKPSHVRDYACTGPIVVQDVGEFRPKGVNNHGHDHHIVPAQSQNSGTTKNRAAG